MQKITNIFFRFCLWLTACFGGALLLMSAFVAMGNYPVLFSGEKGMFWEYIALIFLAVFMGFAVVWLYRRLENTGKRCAVILSIAILLLQIGFLVFVSHPMTSSDPARVQNEALEMIRRQHGQINMDNEYFQRYENNHSVVVLFYYFYKILFQCGIRDVWIPTVILNVLCVDIGIYISYRTGRMLKGDAFANLLLVCFLLCPTTYVWLTTAYTNTFSFPYIMGILYLGLSLRVTSSRRKVIMQCILLGFIMAIGYWIRPTTILPIIALLLFTEVVSKKRNTMLEGVIILAVFLLCFAGCRLIVRQHVNQSKLMGTFPITHWIMMGLNEESQGSIDNNMDPQYTAGFPTKEEKRKANIEEIKKRLKNMGVKGVVKLGARKIFRVWAVGHDGSLSKAEYAKDFPVLYEKFMGDTGGWYLLFTQAFRVCIFVFLFFSAIAQLRQKQCTEMFLFALTFLGAVLFFLIWEANKRYNVCFVGVYLLLMADGIHNVAGYALYIPEGRLFCRVPVKWCFVCIATFSLLGSVFLQIFMLKKSINNVGKRFYNSSIEDADGIDKDLYEEPFLVEQTIWQEQLAMSGQWNQITIYFSLKKSKKKKIKEEYLAELYSMEDMRCLYQEKIGRDQLGEDGGLPIKLSKQKEMSEGGYLLRLTHIGNDFDMIPLVNRYSALDLYPDGKLSVNGRETEYDLSMSLEQKKQ